jgi:PAS domain S-box-containing protein
MKPCPLRRARELSENDTVAGEHRSARRTRFRRLGTSVARLQVTKAELSSVAAPRAVHSLQHSEERFRLLVDGVLDYAIYMLDAGGRVVSWNAGAERLKGYSPAEAVGQPYGLFFSPEDQLAKKPQRLLARAEAEGKCEDEGWRVRKDGSRFWAHVVLTALRDSSGKLRGFAKVTHDVTANRQAMDALRTSEQRFRLLVQAVRDYAIFMLDPSGVIVSWNAGAERLKGYRAEEIIGQHFSVFYSERDRASGHPEEELTEALRSGSFQEEGWRIRKDGSRFWASVLITAVLDEQSQLVGFAKVTRDVTERRDAEEQLRRANEDLERRVRQRTEELTIANGELEAFSYSVSHDLKAPLRSLDGFSRMLIERANDRLTEQERDYLQRIRRASQRMTTLTDAMLALSRLTSAPIAVQRVDLSRLVREIAAELSQAEPDRVVQFEVVGEAFADADPRLARIAIDNLVRNAWKFTRKQPEPRIEFGCESSADGAMFFVRDNGVGFDMGQVDRLFIPFQRLHRASDFEGTGIGLATVNRVLRRHGGRVWARAEPGAGATFYFTFETPASA